MDDRRDAPKAARDITLTERANSLNSRTEDLLSEIRTAAIGIENALFQSSTPIGSAKLGGAERPGMGSLEALIATAEDHAQELSEIGQFLATLRARIEPSLNVAPERNETARWPRGAPIPAARIDDRTTEPR